MSSYLRSMQTAARAVAVNKHDIDPLTRGRCVALYIGTAGDLHFKDGSGTEVALTAVAAGLFPVQVLQVYTDSTAADMLALYDE